MVYKALYREWRPQDFQSLVGQEHISRSLLYAVKTGRIAHAYLFAGPRGTGKTSTAKILAKAVNCLSLQDGEPCNTCENCRNISEGHSMDVLEIDAASNRGIDEIRDIRERVNFVPSQGKYKVYIIDEVHMLTAEAFNALLKTLEEPPAHAIFILATTEAHKIPPTIMSRCQRYDFRRISAAQMEARLREILESAQLQAEEGALTIIARKAEGGLRDAISLLDQCISFGGDYISRQTVYEVAGLVKSDSLLAINQAVIDQDASGLMTTLNALIKEGIEPAQILRDYMEYLRNIVLLLVCGADSALVLSTPEEKEILQKQGKQLGFNRLSQMIAYLVKTESESRWRPNMRIVLEMALFSLMFPAIEDQTPALLKAPEAARKTGKDKSGTAGEQQGFKERRGLEEQKRGTVKEEDQKQEIKPQVIKDPPAPDAKKAGQADGPPELSLQEIKSQWPLVMEKIKGMKKTVYAYMTACEPSELRDAELVLGFKGEYSFHKEKVEETANRKFVEGILAKVFGRELHINCVLESNNDPGEPADPVQKAIELFGADVVVIKD